MPAHSLPFQDALPSGLQGLLSKSELAGLPGNRSTNPGANKVSDMEGGASSNNGQPLTGQQVRQINQYQSILTWYGVTSELEGGNFIGHCPFGECPELFGHKEPKFSMEAQTGMWRCFRCGLKGNAYNFIREVHKLYLSTTLDEELAALCVARKQALSIPILKEMQVAYNRTTSEWMLPAWGTEGGGILNLYVWRTQFDAHTGDKRRQILSGPTFKHVPYGIHRLRSGTQRPIWILEGHWDYLAFNSLLADVNLHHQIDTLGVPGAGTFPRQFLGCLNGREIVLAFDNDQAGRDGAEGLMKSMHSNHIIPSSVKVVAWPEDSPKDVSDVITGLSEKWAKKAAKKA